MPIPLLPIAVLAGLALVASSKSTSSGGAAPPSPSSDVGSEPPKRPTPTTEIPSDVGIVRPPSFGPVPTTSTSSGRDATVYDLSAWPDVVTYPGVPSYPSGWVLRDKPIGLLGWTIRLPKREIKPRKIGPVRVRDPRVVAVELGLRPDELQAIASTFLADGRLTRISKSRPLSSRYGLAWPAWIDRYPAKGESWLVRAGIYSLPWRPSDVLAILPFLARSHVEELRAGRQPIDPEELWSIWLAALSYWSQIGPVKAPADQLAEWWISIFGRTYFGGGLDKDPRTTPSSEAVGWFSSLVVGPTATFLAAYGGASSGGSSSGSAGSSRGA